MCPHALIPYKPKNPKTRLSSILSQEEREQFAEAMLAIVLGQTMTEKFGGDSITEMKQNYSLHFKEV